MNCPYNPHDDLLQHCTSPQQVEVYEQLLQKTADALHHDQLPDLKPRNNLQQLLREKVAAHQVNVHKSSIAIMPKNLPILTLSWQNKWQFHFPTATAVAAAICLCTLLGHFIPSGMSPTIVAQDSLSMQQGDTLLQLDSQMIKPLYSDTVKR